MSLTTITPEHREAAAKSLKGDDAKTALVRERIRAGKADEHPRVQAAAFYGERTPEEDCDYPKHGRF